MAVGHRRMVLHHALAILDPTRAVSSPSSPSKNVSNVSNPALKTPSQTGQPLLTGGLGAGSTTTIKPRTLRAWYAAYAAGDRAMFGLAITQMILLLPLGFLYFIGFRRRNAKQQRAVAIFFFVLSAAGALAILATFTGYAYPVTSGYAYPVTSGYGDNCYDAYGNYQNYYYYGPVLYYRTYIRPSFLIAVPYLALSVRL